MGEAIVLDMAAAVPLTTNSVTNSLTELSIVRNIKLEKNN